MLAGFFGAIICTVMNGNAGDRESFRVYGSEPDKGIRDV